MARRLEGEVLMGLFIVSILGLFLSACITGWNYGLTICLTGVFMGAWLVFTGRKYFGWGLVGFCGLSFLILAIWAR